MKNCLLTQLKAATNNPNLPILETMKQFTLDAITASGNSSMSDAQKGSLNHFFIQIGAINNNGIFAKMDYIFLPCICGKNISKAFVNYKDNTTVASSDTVYQFDGNGIIKGSSVTGNYGSVQLNSNYSFDQNNVSLAVGCYQPTNVFARVTSEVCRIIDKQTSSIDDKPSILYRNLTPTYYYGFRMLGYDFGTDVKDYNSVVTVFDSNEQNASFYKNEVLDYSGVEQSTEPTFSSAVDLRQLTSGIPIGITMYGKALTTTERQKLAVAIKDLILSFEDNSAN